MASLLGKKIWKSYNGYGEKYFLGDKKMDEQFMETMENMDSMIRCLALQLPESVHREVVNIWINFKKSLPMTDKNGDITDIKRTIRLQRGLAQIEMELAGVDAAVVMDILKRNNIWFADITN
jgi:uncharacterized protein YecE (DUF72 family)